MGPFAKLLCESVKTTSDNCKLNEEIAKLEVEIFPELKGTTLEGQYLIKVFRGAPMPKESIKQFE